jgi:hypothetical protein
MEEAPPRKEEVPLVAPVEEKKENTAIAGGTGARPRMRRF